MGRWRRGGCAQQGQEFYLFLIILYGHYGPKEHLVQPTLLSIKTPIPCINFCVTNFLSFVHSRIVLCNYAAGVTCRKMASGVVVIVVDGLAKILIAMFYCTTELRDCAYLYFMFRFLRMVFENWLFFDWKQTNAISYSKQAFCHAWKYL